MVRTLAISLTLAFPFFQKTRTVRRRQVFNKRYVLRSNPKEWGKYFFKWEIVFGCVFFSSSVRRGGGAVVRPVVGPVRTASALRADGDGRGLAHERLGLVQGVDGVLAVDPVGKYKKT